MSWRMTLLEKAYSDFDRDTSINPMLIIEINAGNIKPF